ncbi:MAG TPA: hypothetical protein VHJ17_13930 [Thermomonospora sp.]|nr:hypothetical protein [Thermomonospora sp.]
MTLTKRTGLLLAGTGALHFAAPRLFEPVSRLAFPEDTRRWVYTNGATEVVLGLAVAGERTRRAGLAGVAAYTLWLGARAARRRG